MRKLLIATAALAAAVMLFLGATLPPAPSASPPPFDVDLDGRTVAGAYHVHSTISDGAADRATIAGAAARAGLRFVIFTDHGDGTRRPEPPQYVHGVLCLDAVEISTNGGHYVALDMRTAPYPLGGEASAVVEDVRRLGGFGIAAHPFSGKRELQWRDWSAPLDGLEWLNADSEWRDERWTTIARVPLYYPVRSAAALALLLDRPVAAMARWDTLTAVRPAVGLAAHDAHGGLLGGDDGPRRPRLRGVPSYEASFRAFALRAVLPSPLTGVPQSDGRMVLDAIRRGRVFAAIDAVASPALLDFHASHAGMQATMGDAVLFEPDVELSVRATVPTGGRLRMLCGGVAVGDSETDRVSVRVPGPGACRAEVIVPGAPGDPPVPWLTSNPIYLLPAVAEPVGSEPLVETARALDEVDWLLEKDTASTAAVTRLNGGGFALSYRLGGAGSPGSFVAAVAALRAPLPPFEQVLFTASSAAPMRVSVELRFGGGERWGQSVFIEPDPRRVSLSLSDFIATDGPSDPRPDFRQASSLLFIVDFTNAAPGTAGTLQVRDVALGRPVPPAR